MVRSSKTSFNLLVISLLWFIVILIVNPLREFPLNDDWAYHRTLLDLLETGKLKYEFWVGVPLLPHLFWGLLFVKIFGFSFSILKIANLIMGLAGVFVTYFIFYEYLRNSRRAFIYSLFVAFNPIYLHLCFSFMSDLTFYTLVAAALLFYLRNLHNPGRYSLELSFLFALLATMTRQIGLFLPVSIFLHQVIISYPKISKTLIKPGLYSISVIAVLFIFNAWLDSTGNKPMAYRELSEMLKIENALTSIAWQGLIQVGHWFLELGLWFFPLILIGILNSKDLIRRYYKQVIVFTILVLPVIIRMSANFPRGNIFYDLGLGPKTLADTFLMGIHHDEKPFLFLTWILKLLAITGGTGMLVLLVIRMTESIKGIRKEIDNEAQISIFALILIIMYFGVLLISFTFFDRYLTALFIPWLILMIPKVSESKFFILNRWRSWLVISYLAILLYFGITATHDYLSWNSTRWLSADYLIKQGVDPEKIDGGFEYNGWNKIKMDVYGRWDPGQFNYVITFGGMENLDTLNTFKYQNGLPYETREIYILIRTDR